MYFGHKMYSFCKSKKKYSNWVVKWFWMVYWTIRWISFHECTCYYVLFRKAQSIRYTKSFVPKHCGMEYEFLTRQFNQLKYHSFQYTMKILFTITNELHASFRFNSFLSIPICFSYHIACSSIITILKIVIGWLGENTRVVKNASIIMWYKL